MGMDQEPSSDNSPNKRLKTLIPVPDSHPHSPPSYISKGKSIIEEEAPQPIQKDVEIDCCGICLSEASNGGGVSRGRIDSCNHYFCFVCIMEWAKVESKCPFCKRRFSTIRRPPKPPVFPSERIVRVPVRDQVYHYLGNAPSGPSDPYSESKCSVCCGTADESLLLLCDLCDSAAHTYCVGLGITVPEGDWFCQDCTLLKDEHSKSEIDTVSFVQHSVDTVHQISSANKEVSVFDIVQEPCAQPVQRSRRVASDPCYLPPPSSTDDETSMINNICRPVSTGLAKPNARTLRRCRNVQDRIRVLRENWNGFQSGRVCFSSSPGDGSTSSQKSTTCNGSTSSRKSTTCNGSTSSQKSMTCKSAQDSVSCLNQQSAAQCSSSDMTNDSRTHEIDKAWKMLDKAMSIKQVSAGSSIVRQASKLPTRKLNICKDADHLNYRHLSADSPQNGLKNVGITRPGDHFYYSLGKDYHKQPSSMSGKQQLRSHMNEDVTKCFEGSMNGRSPRDQELKHSQGAQNPSHPYNASVRGGETLPAEKSFKAPASGSSPTGSEQVVLIKDIVKGANHTSSSNDKAKHAKEKSQSEKICVDSQRYNDAKVEIQSLVKLNLKLQTKEEKLGVAAFKEVARLATHSILAACGLEHPKPSYCSIPGFKCSHPSEVQNSSLMRNSCRECFYVFVKDMINTVLLHRKSTDRKT